MKKKIGYKLISIFSSISLLLQSLTPLLYLAPATTAYANPPAELKSEIKFDNSASKFTINLNNADVNVSGKLSYLLSYQTDKQLEGAKGSDINIDNKNNFSKEIYAGICSANGTCVPHNIIRGIFKTEIKDVGWLNGERFTIENGELKIDKDENSDSLDLNDQEKYWLAHGTNLTPTPQPTQPQPTETPTPEPTITITPTPLVESNEPVPERGIIEAIVVPANEDIGYYFNPYLVPDRPDYAPTDTVILSGTGFRPNISYILDVYSDNYSLVEIVTTDAKGNFVYSFQLDGVYRPNYQVEVTDTLGNVIATTTFTDRPILPRPPPSGTIIVEKQTFPDGDQTYFDFSGDVQGQIKDDGQIKKAYPPGHYVAIESVPIGWQLASIECTDDDSAFDLPNKTAHFNLDPGEIVKCTFTNKKLGNLFGRKYEDADGDSAPHETGEDFLGGWKVRLYGRLWNYFGEKTTGHTGLPGQYHFGNLPIGIYHVCEVLTGGWTQTWPQVGDFPVDDNGLPHPFMGVAVANQSPNAAQEGPVCWKTFINQPGDTNAFLRFGNTSGSISGYKFNDLNGNGHWEATPGLPAEVGLADWTIYIDSDGDGSLDPTEPNMPTGTNGEYSFSDLLPDTYSVCEEPQPGWINSWPGNNSNCHTVTLDPGQDITNLNFGNQQLGSIIVEKQTIPHGNTQSFTFTSSWGADFNLKDGESISSGYLLPGTYSVNENIPDGWDLTNATCSDGIPISAISLQAGETITCKFTNTKLATAIIKKLMVGDTDTFTFTGTPAGDISQNNGIITATNLVPGQYLSTESAKVGWSLTSIACDNDNSFGDITSGTTTFNLEADQMVTCTYTNNFIPPILSISKSNNRYPNSQSPGGNVTYTIKVAASDNTVYNVKVTDILPGGFTYRSGSWRALSSDRGPLTITEPHYASPGAWDIGTINKDEIITLTYLADISANQDPGLYLDLAWSQGTQTSDSSSPVILASADIGKIDGNDNFVGTAVPVSTDTENYTSADVESEQQGEVLGATTTALPSTGANPFWLILVSFLIGLGSLLTLLGLLVKKNKLGFLIKIIGAFIIVCWLTLFAFKTSASAAGLSIRLSEPNSLSRITDFNLYFVALDLNNNPITVKCFYQKSNSGYSQFGGDIYLQAGGNNGYCSVSATQIDESGKTYSFYATADNGQETPIQSNIITVDYNVSGPGTPTYYSKEQVTDCQNRINFKTADDGGKTVKVEIYRSQATSFGLDPGNRVAVIDIGSNTSGNFFDNVPDCDQTYYYVIRAFDIYGNGSDWVGDSVTITTTTTAIQPTSVLIPVTNVILPSEAAVGETLGEKAKATEEGKVLGEKKKEVTPTKIVNKQTRTYLIIGLIIILTIIGYVLYRKSHKTTKN